MYRTDDFLLVLFLIAWSQPLAVSYRVHQASFRPNGSPLDHRPFNCLEAFERWENGQEALPNGRYFVWLNRDVRVCAVSAIDALLCRVADEKTSADHLDAYPPSKPVPVKADEVPNKLHFGYLGLRFDDGKLTATRENYDGVSIDFSRSRLNWAILKLLDRAKESWVSIGQLREVWDKHGVAKNPSKGTIHDGIHEVRKLLEKLGLTIVNSRGVGWRIEPASKSTETHSTDSDMLSRAPRSSKNRRRKESQRTRQHS